MKNNNQKELINVINKENKFIKSSMKPLDIKIVNDIKEKVPTKLEQTLEKAFLKAFDIVFIKGTNLIEKSYSKEKILNEYLKNDEKTLKYNDRKSLKYINSKSNSKANINIAFSTFKGAGFGILGIGPMDIPLFLSQILKSIYEISISFGYDYTQEKEKIFILKIIYTSLLEDNRIISNNIILDKMIRNDNEYKQYHLEDEIKNVSNILCTKLLVSKFVQGLPLIGVAGGVYDGIFLDKILKFAKLKYYHRYLYNKTLNNI